MSILQKKSESEFHGSKFNNPEALTEKWLSDHAGHVLVWMNRTRFVNTKGIIYRECRCYSCFCAANEAIGKTKACVQKYDPPARLFHRPRPRRTQVVDSAEILEASIPKKKKSKISKTSKTSKTSGKVIPIISLSTKSKKVVSKVQKAKKAKNEKAKVKRK
jgi:hypothetical protein